MRLNWGWAEKLEYSEYPVAALSLASAERYADALIEIAAGWRAINTLRAPGYMTDCLHCGRDMTDGCRPWCPGLHARRALGVA